MKNTMLSTSNSCTCGRTDKRATVEERVTAHELTHVHRHTHPKYYEGPELRPFPVTHSHNHAHTLNDDHHSVTKAKEGKDV